MTPTKIHLTFRTDASGDVLIDKASPEPFVGSEEFVRAQGWQGMDSAPRDRSHILAIIAPNTSRHLEHLVGRAFVIWHEGVTKSGYDLGWAVFPGFGGAPDHYFSAWKPLDLPPSPSEKGVG